MSISLKIYRGEMSFISKIEEVNFFLIYLNETNLN